MRKTRGFAAETALFAVGFSGEARAKKARRGFPQRKSGLPDLCTHKKTDLGQARDRLTVREFQFHK
jgi:hypothetical protein